MSGYRELLEATIAHLEALKESGDRFVVVDRPALAALAKRPARGTPQGAKPPAPASPAAEGTKRSPLPAAKPGASAGPARALPSGAAARWNRAVAAADPSNRAAEVSPPASPPLARDPKRTPAEREAAMNDLRRRAAECVRCPHLASSRRSVVVGVGDVNARLLFVGEAPGADEDRQGEPFVGAAGELLTKIIVAMNLSRDRVFIANVLKCRPDTPGQTFGNRKPTPQEMATCLPWLQEQIEILQPEVMVALGATAVEGLMGRPMPITKLRGQWQNYRGIPLMPTYHP
ncbi:MAG: uracil-DNA glycosylase, partial [Verrucomicrobiae bacterium]|nr:uracil-DNA glycosylase [Verrucomicrobiae bacterium]